MLLITMKLLIRIIFTFLTVNFEIFISFMLSVLTAAAAAAVVVDAVDEYDDADEMSANAIGVFSAELDDCSEILIVCLFSSTLKAFKLPILVMASLLLLMLDAFVTGVAGSFG